MKIHSILHASFLIDNLDESLRFYCDILGLQIDPHRPDLGYPGVWLRINDTQQIHLLQLPNPDSQQRPEHGGHDRHVALQVDSISELETLLTQKQIGFTKSKSRTNVLFVRDPDNNALELIATG